MNETMATIEVMYVAKIFDDNGLVIAKEEYTNYMDAREFVKMSLKDKFIDPTNKGCWSRYTKYLDDEVM